MTRARTVFMFSGQGSQYFHMGRELWDGHGVFRRAMLELDAMAQAELGCSVVEQIFQSSKTKADRFDRTLYTHPAIFMVEYALAQTLAAEGIRPDVVVGSSLGELTAATVAGALGPRAAIAAVIQQAKAIEGCCPPGSMLAVLDDPRLHQEIEPLRAMTLVSVGFDRHFVLSAGAARVREAESYLRSRALVYQVLPVSHGFHSPQIDAAERGFAECQRRCTLGVPTIPFVSSVTGGFLDDFGDDYFWRVARRPILFREATAALERSGGGLYLDLGPAETLGNLVKYNLRPDSPSRTMGVISPFGAELRRLERVVALARGPQ
jgi:acyl transferase domain-containing protein